MNNPFELPQLFTLGGIAVNSSLDAEALFQGASCVDGGGCGSGGGCGRGGALQD